MVIKLSIEYSKCLNFEQSFGQTFAQMPLFLKILSGKVNNADPDQTAPSGAVWSGPTLFEYAVLSESLENIWD